MITLRCITRLAIVYLLHSMAAVTEIGAKVHSGRAKGGSDVTDITDYPYMVAIFKEQQLHASGVIMTVSAILTCCHCLKIGSDGDLIPVDQFEVRAGVADVDQKSGAWQLRRVSRLDLHPDCKVRDKVQFENDVGVIILDGQIDITEAVRPATFFSKDPVLALLELSRLTYEKSTCTSVGYGQYKTDSNGKGVLNKVIVQLQSPRNCALEGKLHQVCVTRVCSAGDLCTGDSGSPLVCDGFIFGVMSRGFCNTNRTSYYTSIESLLYFIDK